MDKIEMYGLRWSFTPLVHTTPIDDASSAISLTQGRPFNHFLSIDISGEEFEAPSYFVNIAIKAKTEGYDRLCIPMFINRVFSSNMSMVGTILTYFSRCGWTERLKCVQTNRGEIYYGTPGIILDKDFKILFLTTVTVRVRGESVELVKAACRIPCEVLERQNELLPKTIYKKFIPMYATTPIENIPILHRESTAFSQKADVIIGTGANIMFTTEIPKPSTATDEEYNRIIRNNLDSLE